MQKAGFILWVVGGLVVTYIILTILMPTISTLASDGAAEIGTSPNAATYAASTASLNYIPLVLYFVPSVLGIGAIVWRLKHD